MYLTIRTQDYWKSSHTPYFQSKSKLIDLVDWDFGLSENWLIWYRHITLDNYPISIYDFAIFFIKILSWESSDPFANVIYHRSDVIDHSIASRILLRHRPVWIRSVRDVIRHRWRKHRSREKEDPVLKAVAVVELRLEDTSAPCVTWSAPLRRWPWCHRCCWGHKVRRPIWGTWNGKSSTKYFFGRSLGC